MKVAQLRRLNSDDYHNAPEWFLTFVDNMNVMIDNLNPLLQNGIDIDNNITAERQTVTLSHATPIKIKLNRLTTTPKIVRVGYAAGLVGVAAITAFNADGTITITVYFQGTPPTTPILTTLVMEP